MISFDYNYCCSANEFIRQAFEYLAQIVHDLDVAIKQSEVDETVRTAFMNEDNCLTREELSKMNRKENDVI
ncbi:hypothetical protein [Pseudogracilibacillus auburnensis]|uniref:hypothetical protein n=1 Tax=Pseudogracilibacillus auburnensis TaxID=1494959 RepID=UPI001A959B52|nr:hypothetical protein [Pseudogracilibacillus auburnensis]MBO1005259.1 hypothetical protein [Pseudogracilibacillus auburnensis]